MAAILSQPATIALASGGSPPCGPALLRPCRGDRGGVTPPTAADRVGVWVSFAPLLPL